MAETKVPGECHPLDRRTFHAEFLVRQVGIDLARRIRRAAHGHGPASVQALVDTLRTRADRSTFVLITCVILVLLFWQW